MKKSLISAPARLFAAMPLIFGLAAIVAAPNVEAVTIWPLNIVNGQLDVDSDGNLNEATDDLLDVALWCDDAAPIQVDIRNGYLDVDEDGTVGEAADDLVNCDLANENAGVPISDPVDIINGCVDVNEDTFCNNADTALDIQIFNLP